MNVSLEGKVAYITGAARGQGRAHALRLAAAGVDIIGMDLCEDIDGIEYPLATQADLDETAAQVEALGRRMYWERGDVRDHEFLEGLAERGRAELGRIDFVIANAGVMPLYGPRSNERGAWTLALDVLLTGVMNTVEATYRHIVEQGDGGSIVLIASMAAEQPMMRTEIGHSMGNLGYAAAKAGVVNMAANYASLLASHRIRVNALCPAGVATPMVENPMVDHFYTNVATPEDCAVLVPAIAIDKVESEDVAGAAFWLCSDDSRYFTGSTMRIDGGAYLR
ncbi:short-chain dehydrogenase/reductase [Gordonia spumicola]|uniref:Short-chain dehydrogenase/reductase n=1 Tax=Gordonia spumicola TaxID=589161 RepID=A0A7I9V3T4_9ACTN|nr:mycofactocin-coupled SDR family oxidoreductase [Gordonia spumicola]GED99831.1 short-chain dehydrogenase/reductase [Gordonia spumicola]